MPDDAQRNLPTAAAAVAMNTAAVVKKLHRRQQSEQ